MSEPKWMDLARDFIGVREIRGAQHNPEIIEWFKESGHGWIKDDETAWCAAFANAMLERVDIKGTNSVAARSFLDWGRELKKPKPGALAVFWRGNKNGWQGHVGFYVGETATHVQVLGGNQKDAVSIASYDKDQLLGYRWPSTIGTSRTVKAAVAVQGGNIAGMVEPVQEAVAVVQGQQEAMSTGSIVGLVIGAIITIGVLVVLYARWDDLGRPKPW
jgi:uncharacterized protein (TIGR02594 family)